MKHGFILCLALFNIDMRGMDLADLEAGIPSAQQAQEEIRVMALEDKLGISLCNGVALFDYLKKNKVADPEYQSFIKMVGSRDNADQKEDLSALCKALIEFQGQHAAMLRQKIEQDAALNKVALRSAQYRLYAGVVIGAFGLVSLIMNAIQGTNLFCAN